MIDQNTPKVRSISFDEAKRRYLSRFTCEHIPVWAKYPRKDGSYYAPHYLTDLEWYNSTAFPGEPDCAADETSCFSHSQSWPLGSKLSKPYQIGDPISKQLLILWKDTEDVQWLKDVHGIELIKPACAVVYGNEDSPEKIELYSSNNYKKLVATITPKAQQHD